MGWEKRGNSREYFYLSYRKADGTVGKRYLGRGAEAQFESMRLSVTHAAREHRLNEQRRIRGLESETNHSSQAIRNLIEAHYFAAGLHNPGSRGWRRRKEVIKLVKQETEERQDGSEGPQEPDQETLNQEDLDQLVVLARRGNREAAKQIRELLNRHPDLFRGLGHAATKVQVKWIRAITGSNLFDKEMLLHGTGELRNRLVAQGDGSELDRLAVEQVLSSQLQLTYHENREAEEPATNLKIAEHRAKQIERASRRHMRALGALTTLRLLKSKLKETQEQTTDGHRSEDQHRTVTIPAVISDRFKDSLSQNPESVAMN